MPDAVFDHAAPAHPASRDHYLDAGCEWSLTV